KNKRIDIPEKFKFHKKKVEIRNMNDESIKRLSREEIASINEVARDMLELHGYKVVVEVL
ncbi:MAG: hypothetical protein SV375_09275, partial [Thermodesulfobacteriota bacterium]|nr:hypothetical protein [Thermodesulfobacteriota bacterium]